MTETNSKIERSIVLDLVKGFAIINIIWIHTVWWSGIEYIPNEFIRQLALFVDVPLFFFLSGWAVSLHKSSWKGSFKRFAKLYIPYVLMLIPLAFALIIFYDRAISLETILGWLSFTKRESFEFGAVMGSMWFLPPFIIISMLSPLLSSLLKHRKLSQILILFLILASIVTSIWNIPIINSNILGLTSLRVLFFYCLFFFSGMYSKDVKITAKQFFFVLSGLLIMLLVALSITGFDLKLQENKFPPTMLYMLISLFSILITIYLRNFEDQIRLKLSNNRMLRFLNYSGVNVYNIYLYQGFGGSAIYAIVYSCRMNINWVLLLAICFAFNLLISYLLAYIFSKPNIAILKLMEKRENES